MAQEQRVHREVIGGAVVAAPILPKSLPTPEVPHANYTS